jgi:hypothetical protein
MNTIYILYQKVMGNPKMPVPGPSDQNTLTLKMTQKAQKLLKTYFAKSTLIVSQPRDFALGLYGTSRMSF